MKKHRQIIKMLLSGIVIALVLLLTFMAGVHTGRKGEYGSFPFWEKRHTFRDRIPANFKNHGVIGIIDSIGQNTLVVKDRSGTLKTAIVDNSTIIRRERTAIQFSDLKTGEKVIVFGEPQEKEGAIKAKIVRVINLRK